ncbi:MAG: ATP-grasp domain-containing protein [bacterium]
MNFVFLSPVFPPNYYRFCVNLKKEGATVLGIAENDFGELRPELRESLAWYYRVGDMHNCGELREAMRFFTDRFGQISRIDSLNEYWLETEARLRTEFGIFGVQAANVANIRRKSLMKIFFARAGIPHARGMVVRDAQQARAFAAAETGFPVIVKPDDGIGAAMTYQLNSCEGLDRFFANKPDREFIMEEFIEGDIVSFDGMADKEGKIVFCTSHVYGQRVMEAVLADSHISYYSLREIPGDLEEAGRKLVDGFAVRERFFHFEFFRRKDGSLCAMEVNIRPPGGMTMDMFNFSCDIDMYSAWAKMMAHGAVRLDYSRKYHCAFAGRKNRLGYRHSHGEIMERLNGMVLHHQDLPEVLARVMGDYGYLIRSGDSGSITEAVNFIQALVN